MSSSTFFEDGAARSEIGAALRAMPQESAPESGWKAVQNRYDRQRWAQTRRRNWGGGLAAAASIAVAVIGVRLGVGMFSASTAPEIVDNAGVGANHAEDFASSELAATVAAEGLQLQLAQMDMDALIAFSRFQEERLRALPVTSLPGPGHVLEVDSFSLVTGLEDQIALLDEGLIPASFESDDQAIPRRLLQERAMLMDDLFSLRRAQAAQVGFIHADF